MSTQGEISMAAAGSGRPSLAGPQLHGDRQPAAGRVAGERDVPGRDALVQQPAVGGQHVVDRRRVAPPSGSSR